MFHRTQTVQLDESIKLRVSIIFGEYTIALYSSIYRICFNSEKRTIANSSFGSKLSIELKPPSSTGKLMQPLT